MDRAELPVPSRDLIGIPGYLKDGYTDLGFFPTRNRREKILVDKERLSRELVTCKRQAIEEVSQVGASAELLETHLRELGSTLHDPFMAMSFLALEVIPSLKLTDQGLIDVESFERVPLWVG